MKRNAKKVKEIFMKYSSRYSPSDVRVVTEDDERFERVIVRSRQLYLHRHDLEEIERATGLYPSWQCIWGGEMELLLVKPKKRHLNSMKK